MKEFQFVVAIIKSRNWDESGAWTVRLGLEDIGGVSPRDNGRWGYTLWDSGHTSEEGFDDRIQAAFRMIYVKMLEIPIDER